MENSACAWYLKYAQGNPGSKLVGSTWAYLWQKERMQGVSGSLPRDHLLIKVI